MENKVFHDFSGGMNNVLDAKMLPDNTWREIRNAEVIDGNLVPINAPGDVGIYDSLEDINHYGDIGRSVVKWWGKYYWSNNTANSEPYYGGSFYAPGIAYPDAVPTVTTVTSEEDSLNGTYQYCWTYVNGDSWESAPGGITQWWRTITINEKAAHIIIPIDVPSGIETVKLYRTINQGNDFYLVGEYSPGDIVIDSIQDIDLVLGNQLETINLLPPPDNGKFLTEFGNVFFVAVGDRLYFSEINNPHGFNPNNWIGFDAEITGSVKEFMGLLIFTNNKTYRVVGTDASTISKEEIPGTQGCINARTIATFSNAPVWVSHDGICIWDGQSITIISYKQVNMPDSIHAVCFDDKYFLFTTSDMLIYNFRDKVFTKADIVADYAWYDSDANSFYLATISENYSVKMWGIGGKMQVSCSRKIPRSLNQRRWKRILFDSDGTITGSFANKTFSLNGEGKKIFRFPAGFYLRNNISMEIISDHVVYGIAFEYENFGT